MNSFTESRPSSELRLRGETIWRELHKHPFIRRIGDGTLEAASFRFFLEQDYKFLVEYVRVLGYGVSRSNDLSTMQYFADLLRAVLDAELQLCRDSAKALGVEFNRLQNGLLAPATQGYTDFLVRTASQGDFVELPAAILPCSWSYVEIAQALSSTCRESSTVYQKWIDTYASEEMVEVSNACRELVDRSIRNSGERGMELATKAFLMSSRYELAFWEAALRREEWSV